MAFNTRVNKLTDYAYSPTDPASEDAIRLQVDNAVQEAYDNVQTALSSIVDGDSGGDNVKITPIYVLDTVQGALEELKQELINIVQAGLTTGAVTDVYLSDLPGMIKERLGDVIERQNNTDLTLLYNDLNDFVENLSPVSFVDVFPNETYTAPETTALYNAGNKTYEFDDTGLELYQTVSLAFSAFTKATALLIPKEIKKFTPDQDYTNQTVIKGSTNAYELVTGESVVIDGLVVTPILIEGTSVIVDWTTTPKTWALANGYDLNMGSGIGQDGNDYSAYFKSGTGIKVFKETGTGSETELCSVNDATIQAVEDSFVFDSDGNIILAFDNASDESYVLIIDPLTATGDQFVNKEIWDSVGNTEVTETKITINASDKIFVAMKCKNSSANNNTVINRRGRTGTVTAGVITWDFATEQITDSATTSNSFAIGWDGNIAQIASIFGSVSIFYLRRDTTLSQSGAYNPNWSFSGNLTSSGVKGKIRMITKIYGTTGRIQVYYDEDGNAESGYTDNNGALFNSQQIATNATAVSAIEVAITKDGLVEGDVLLVYQDYEGGGIKQLKVLDGTTTPIDLTTLTENIVDNYKDGIDVVPWIQGDKNGVGSIILNPSNMVVEAFGATGGGWNIRVIDSAIDFDNVNAIFMKFKLEGSASVPTTILADLVVSDDKNGKYDVGTYVNARQTGVVGEGYIFLDTSTINGLNYIKVAAILANTPTGEFSTLTITEVGTLSAKPQHAQKQDSAVQNGNYLVNFKDVTDFKTTGEAQIGSLTQLTFADPQTMLQSVGYVIPEQFSPLLNDVAMTFEGISKGGLVYEQDNPETDSVFKTTGKSVDLDGIGIAVY